ncbi:MAG: LamG domain-containing protein, partial [Pseudomonadota bacterium]|nr:LamG domain-containing protein [Pseudomonadota bacterium]
SGDTENWHTNKGSGGGFTENGELTYSSSRPGQSASLSGSGYFVEMPYFVDADLGGISGASQTCLTELNNNDWLGKDNAIANGQLASTNVRAWLCDANGCNDFVPDTEYFYASMWQPTAGGASMTSTAEGYLEDDGVSFESSGVFGFNAQMHEYWTGRTTTNGIQPDNCNNWTSSASGPVSYVGTADVTFYPEKLYKYSKGCEIADEVTFICIVDPPGCHAQGAMKYNADFNVMEYCNGTEWVSMGPVGGTPPTDGLVGHWTLDETSGTFADSSGNSNTGTESGGVGYDQFGILGRAVSFDGADDLIDVGSNAVLDDLGPLSVCAWVKPDSYGGGGFGRIFSKANNLNTSFYVENDSSAPDETLAFYVNGASNLRVKGQDGWLASGFIGEWNHVCVSWDGVLDDATGVKLYRNATEAPSYGEQLNGALPRTSDAAENGYIGNNGVNSRDFDGMIDEVRVYNRVLSATEIQQLYYYGLSNGLGDVDNGCTSPAANEGEMIYNADFNVMQYCNGEQWIGLGQ